MLARKHATVLRFVGTLVPPSPVRKAAVAGRWYPERDRDLTAAVDAHLSSADAAVSGASDSAQASELHEIVAIIAPHAGLMYSGAVAAHAYRQLRGRPIEVAVLVGPSHFEGFDGVAMYASGAFATPLGPVAIDDGCAAAVMAHLPLAHDRPSVHAREHSLEMQLPFLRRVLPDARIVPILVGWQTADTALALGAALASAVRGRRAIIVASSDLSHYHDAATAARLDGIVIECVRRFDPDALQQSLDRNPEHACGGGAMVAAMRAARALGADRAAILDYADSGDVSGDKTAVVGYLAAALGRRSTPSSERGLPG